MKDRRTSPRCVGAIASVPALEVSLTDWVSSASAAPLPTSVTILSKQISEPDFPLGGADFDSSTARSHAAVARRDRVT